MPAPYAIWCLSGYGTESHDGLLPCQFNHDCSQFPTWADNGHLLQECTHSDCFLCVCVYL